MNKNFIIIDCSLTNQVGHSYQYIVNTSEIVKKKFKEIIIYCNKKADFHIESCRCKPTFSFSTTGKFSSIKLFDLLLKVFVHNFLSIFTYIKIIKLHKNDLIFFQHIEYFQTPSIVLLSFFCTDLKIVLRTDLGDQYSFIRSFFFKLLLLSKNKNISFFSDSENLLKVYNKLKIDINFLPIPQPAYNEKLKYIKKDQTIKIGFLGRRSHEKGYEKLPDLISFLNNSDLKFEFYIHNYSHNDDDTDYIEIEKSLFLLEKKYKNIEFIEKPLNSDKYLEQLISLDACFLLYNDNYINRTSGIINECFIFSTIPIVFNNTWLGDMVNKYKYGIILDKKHNGNLQKVYSPILHQIQSKIGQQCQFMNTNQLFYKSLCLK